MPEALVRVPGPLRPYAGGRSVVPVALPRSPVPLDTLLRLLAVDCPGVIARTLDEQGGLRRHMNVFVGEENARDVDGLETPVHDGAEVSIIPAISGGAVDYLAAIERDAAALRAVASDLGVPVPSCPGWDVARLARHVGSAHRWAARLIRTAATEYVASEPILDGEPLDALDTGLAELREALRDADPATPVWNWAGQPGGAQWWARRMAHETLVHRWDAEAAYGGPSPLDPELAVDGIDEVLAFLRPKLPGSVHLHCTDVPGEWLVSAAGVTREHAKGDAAVRGTASDIDLALWGRVPFASLETFGDPALVESLRPA